MTHACDETRTSRAKTAYRQAPPPIDALSAAVGRSTTAGEVERQRGRPRVRWRRKCTRIVRHPPRTTPSRPLADHLQTPHSWQISAVNTLRGHARRENSAIRVPRRRDDETRRARACAPNSCLRRGETTVRARARSATPMSATVMCSFRRIVRALEAAPDIQMNPVRRMALDSCRPRWRAAAAGPHVQKFSAAVTFAAGAAGRRVN